MMRLLLRMKFSNDIILKTLPLHESKLNDSVGKRFPVECACIASIVKW